MASELYSRYVPPSKKQTPATPQYLPSPIKTNTPPKSKPTPPPTRNDASSTYARYVPSSKSKSKSASSPAELNSELVSSPSTTKRKHEQLLQPSGKPEKSKKRKKNESPVRAEEDSGLQKTSKPFSEETEAPKSENSMADTVPETTAQLIESDNVKKVKKKRTKSKPPPETETENLDKIDDPKSLKKAEDESTHKKLMEKRDVSLRKAEKIAKRAAKIVGTEEAETIVEEPPELHDLIPLPQPDPKPEAPTQSLLASLPPWLASPLRISPTATAPFSEVGLKEDAAEALHAKGFREAFAVQAAVLPLLLPGKSQQEGDVLVSAATGSGKTLAYVLPMVENISHNQITKLRGLIVLPTRELVRQAREISDICASVFGSAHRKHVRIGTAVGNDTLKSEQASLIEKESFYDPEGYRKQQHRLNAKWVDSDAGSDEDLCDEEEVSSLPDHVIKHNSKVDILISTPGRLVEHLKSTPGFTLEHVKWLVVDEADKLLDQSFQQWLTTVMGSLGSGSRDVRKIILSATMTMDVGQLSGLRLYRPKLVVLEGSKDGPKDKASSALFLPSLLAESGIKVEDENIKPLYLLELLDRCGILSREAKSSTGSNVNSSLEDHSSDDSSEDSSSDGSDSSDESFIKPDDQRKLHIASETPRGVLIFTKSNESAVRLSRLIALLEPSSAVNVGILTSTTRSSTRKATLKSFEAGMLTILVASDLASRGLDLTSLAHVINYDMPSSLTSYVHRVGRTARAGKQGHAWTLFTAPEGRWFWNEIGRAESVQRSGKVDRLNFKVDLFDERRKNYEEALENLGKEANLPQRN